jgi:CheY-like chemotaxis protein
MGLAICRRFAGLMGGTIVVRSRPGEGSVFTLSIPIVHPAAASGAQAVASRTSPLDGAADPGVPAVAGARQATVLVVDDSKDNRDYLEQRLEGGYRVLLAADGKQAIEMTAAERPDIILMDLSLPLVDGWAATRAIKSDAALRSIPIIAVTAHVTARDREAFASAGGDGFLAKPVDEKALFDMLRQHLGRRGGGDP